MKSKKFLALLLSFVMILASSVCTFSVSAAGEPTVTIGSATVKAGETVTVTVDFANNPGVAGMRCDVIYDTTNLTLTTITDKAVIGGQTHNAEENIIFWNNASNQTKRGVVAEFTFAINANAPAGDYKIGLSYNNDDYDIINEAFDTIDVAVVEGTITVEGAPAPEPVINGITATADGVEIAYADKDNADVIKAAIADALVVKAQWTEGKEDTEVAVADVEISVDTANTKATVAYNGFTAEVTYTVAAKPVVYYTVTFKAEGAEDITITVEEGTAIGDQMPDEDPTSGTLAFDGWFDADGNPITANTVVEGDIVATAKFSRIVGDVNCDGVKDSKDAIYLLNHCALPDLYPVDDYDGTLDMNGDGIVSSQDAIFLLNSIAIPALYSLAW